MKERSAIYPGTFDPLTNGHLSIINRTLKIFDKLVVAILTNPQKTPLFSLDERISMIKEVLKDKPNIKVESFDGLLDDYVDKKTTNVIIKGLRALSDFEYEFQMAIMNRKLNREIESLFLMTDFRWLDINSTIIKDVAKFGGEISGLVPPLVCKKVKEKYGY